MSANEKSADEVLGELIKAMLPMQPVQLQGALAARLARFAQKKLTPRKVPRMSIGLREPLIGKAGEVKTVSVPAPAAAPGRVVLFRGEKIIAWDTIEEVSEYGARKGYGTLVMGMKINGKSQWPEEAGKGTPSHHFMSVMAREMLHDVLHPKLTVDITVKFLKDCEFHFDFIGRFVEEVEAGVYAIVPTVPCDREFSSKASGLDEILKEMRSAWRMAIDGGKRCEHCWFDFSEHARWPWHKREFDVEAAVMAPGKSADILVLGHKRLLVVDRVKVSHRDREHFRTDGFNLSDFKAHGGYDKFDYYANLLLPESASELIFRVGNTSPDARAFAGKVKAMEYVA